MGLESQNQCAALPPTVPSNARTVIAAADTDALPVLAGILRNCPDLRRLYLLFFRDASSLLLPEDKRVRLIKLNDSDTLAPQILPVFDAEQVFFAEGRVGFYVSTTFQASRPALSSQLLNICLEYLRGFYSQIAFQALRSWRVHANIIFNLPRLAESRPLAELKDAALRQPVVIIGAGPALDRHLAWLPELQRHAWLVACDAAWLPLDRAGIVPDFVVSTDAGDIVWRFLAELSPRQAQVPLVGLLQSSRPVMRYHAGPLYLCRTRMEIYGEMEKALCCRLPFLDAGQCVGHAAFALAEYLGASLIVMAGFNLAFEGAQCHPQHMAAPIWHVNPPPEDNLVEVPGIDGRPVRTDVSLLLYLREFERRIAAFTSRGGSVWDVTGAGALKKGARNVTAENLLEHCRQFTKTPLQFPKLAADTLLAEHAGELIWQWQEEAGRLLKRIENLRGYLPDRRQFAAAFASAFEANQLPMLIANLRNPQLAAETRFAVEDFFSAGGATETEEKLMATAQNYLRDLETVAALAQEACLLAAGVCQTEPRVVAVLLASEAAMPDAWPLIEKEWRAAGFAVEICRLDLSNLPAVWRACREARAGVVVTFDDTVMPAAWHLPGRVCLNLRTHLPQQAGGFNPAENWLRGYAVVALPGAGVADIDAAAWRKAVPRDRPVYCWSAARGVAAIEASGGSATAPSRLPINWEKIVDRLRAEI